MLLWDVASRSEAATLEGHAGGVTSVVYSQDGGALATASEDGTVLLWDVARRRVVSTFEGHRGGVTSVVFSPDGGTLASGSEDGTVRIWDLASKTQVATLKGHSGGIGSLAFSKDGSRLASGSRDNTIKVWDVHARIEVATLEGHNGDVRSVVFSPDWATLASGSEDGTVLLWDLFEWPGLRTFGLEVISGDGQEGAPGGALANPLVVEVKDQNGEPLPDVGVTYTVTAGDGKLSGRFTVQHTRTDADGLAAITLTLGARAGTNTVVVTLGGRELATFSAEGVGTPVVVLDGDYRKWRLPERATARLGKGAIGQSDRAVAFSPDGRTLAVASGIGVWLYEVSTSRATALLPSRARVHSVAFSGQGTLAAGLNDGQVELWNVEFGARVATLKGHADRVNSVVFSTDGATLASGAEDATIKLWDAATQTEVATLRRHTIGVTSVAFSPDGGRLASGSSDHTVKLWDVAARSEVATLEGHTDGVTSVVFSQNGSTLASGSNDRTVKTLERGRANRDCHS